jgi:hypothetical protein
VLLVSVPYALKAEDAAKLGGRSASDFVLTEQLKEEVRTQVEAQKPATSTVETLVSNPPNLPAITEGPSTFTCATTGDCLAVTQSGTGRALRATATSGSEAALLQQNGTGYGLRVLSQSNYAIYGVVQGAVVGTTYGVRGLVNSTTGAGILGSNQATTGVAYGLMGQTSSVSGIGLFGRALATTGTTVGLTGDADSTSGKGIMGRATSTSGTTMGIYAEARSAGGTALVVNNTASGKLLSGLASGVEKFSVSGSGNLVSASTLSGTQLISTVASGTAPLSVTSNTLVPNLNADLLDGVHAGGFAILGTNIFTTTQSISSGDLSVSSGNISLPETTSAGAGVIYLGGSGFIHACCATSEQNTFVGGSAGNYTTTGSNNTAVGYQALDSITGGYANTASGFAALFNDDGGYGNTGTGSQALYSNSTGNFNTADGVGALYYNSTGSGNTALGHLAGVTGTNANGNKTGENNTFIGFRSGPGTSTQYTNATAIGANAVVSASNALVLGSISGVNGASASVNVGIGTATPSYTLDVIGGGRFTGALTAASFLGSGSGLSGVALLGTVNSGTLSVSGGTAIALSGATSSSGSSAVYGSNWANSSYGKLGTSVSGNATGVYGDGSIYGVYGSGYYGVYGSGSDYGVYGSAPTGVYGSGGTYGVYGSNSSNSSYGQLGTSVGGNATGVYGYSSAYGVYGEGSTYGVYASGNLGASGTKSAVVALPDDRVVELYAMESPENWFEDFGAGELREGAAEVALDPTFALTVNTEAGYHVFVTPNGDCEGLYVTNKTATGFQVRELRGGKSNVAFDYRIVAKRRGYESVRMDQLETDSETVQAIRDTAQGRPGERRKLVLPKRAEAPKAPPERPRS